MARRHIKSLSFFRIAAIVFFCILIASLFYVFSFAAERRPASSSGIPAYAGSPYTEIHGNKPFFKKGKLDKAGFEAYRPLDAKGRCTEAMAMISQDLMPKEERGAIGQVRPSGWHTVKYPDLIPDRYLYNRCHLIGFQLTGENANERNLITGTRYLNVEGMLPFENKVADYIRSTGDQVLYRVTPIFDGNNLLASGVLMEAQSKKAGGVTFCVYCYNVQPGIIINYTNGDSSADKNYSPSASQDPGTAAGSGGSSGRADTGGKASGPSSSGFSGYTRNGDMEGKIPEGTTYILNTNTKKFHYTSCSSVSDMAPHNTEIFNGSREEAISRGFDPCGRCHP